MTFLLVKTSTASAASAASFSFFALAASAAAVAAATSSSVGPAGASVALSFVRAALPGEAAFLDFVEVFASSSLSPVASGSAAFFLTGVLRGFFAGFSSTSPSPVSPFAAASASFSALVFLPRFLPVEVVTDGVVGVFGVVKTSELWSV